MATGAGRQCHRANRSILFIMVERLALINEGRLRNARCGGERPSDIDIANIRISEECPKEMLNVIF